MAPQRVSEPRVTNHSLTTWPKGRDAHRTNRKRTGPPPSPCSGLHLPHSVAQDCGQSFWLYHHLSNSPGDYQEYKGTQRQRSLFTHGSAPGPGRDPHHLWGWPCQQSRQAFLTYHQGQARLLYFNNMLNLGQVATSPRRVVRKQAKGLARGKPRSHSLLPRGSGEKGRELGCFIWQPSPWAQPYCLRGLFQLQMGGLGGGQGPEHSPCVDQFGQTVSAGVTLGPGAGLLEHLLLPACPDGSNPQCLQQRVFWEPQQ